MGIRTERPRNAAFSKERARVQYANRRLCELRSQGVTDVVAWETIGNEIKRGAANHSGRMEGKK